MLKPEEPEAHHALLASPPAASKPEGEGWWPLPRRYLIHLLIMLGFWNVYAMRVNLSEAAEPMSHLYGWSEHTKGIVLSSFFVGYVPGQIPGGILAKRYGGKQVFVVGSRLSLTEEATAEGWVAGDGPGIFVLEMNAGERSRIESPSAALK